MATDRVEERVWDPNYEDTLYVEEGADGNLTITIVATKEDRITIDLAAAQRLRRALQRYERRHA